MNKKSGIILRAVIFTVMSAGAVCGMAQSQYSQALFILDIAPDARSSGMGDIGAATPADVMSQRWNASKYIFAPTSYGLSMSYTPWLNKIAKGMNMGLLSGYARFSNKYAVGVSATYLSIGGIELYTNEGASLGNISSEEYAIDVSYSHRLTDNLSGGITLRYASTFKIEAAGGSGVLLPASAVVGDVAFFYTQPFYNGNSLSFGTCISNLGTKVKRSGDVEYLLPMNWRLGANWFIDIDERNSLSWSFDVNKSLVPKTYSEDITVFDAIGKSFGNGRDFVWATGVEYTFAKAAMLRAGYHHSSESKGFRYFTLGAGLLYNSFRFDASYLLSTSNVSNPLSNTFRISISYLWN